jgi:hypothetical protein
MTFRVGLNPLPWVLTANGFDLSVPVLQRAFGEISQTPFVGIHADPPADLDADGYRTLLTEFGLVPAPGYFSADFADVAIETVVEAAKQHAAIQAALGNTEVFIASRIAPARFGTPAVGADADDGRLRAVIDRLGAAAEAITAEGVRPALHPHVGTWIETEPEMESVLAAVHASRLRRLGDRGSRRARGAHQPGIGPDVSGLGRRSLRTRHLLRRSWRSRLSHRRIPASRHPWLQRLPGQREEVRRLRTGPGDESRLARR